MVARVQSEVRIEGCGAAGRGQVVEGWF